LRREAADDKMRYVSACFDDELTKLEGAEQLSSEVGLRGDATTGDRLAQGRVVALVLSGVRLGEPGERDVGHLTAPEIARDGDAIT
jgi:hypothetical protein